MRPTRAQVFERLKSVGTKLGSGFLGDFASPDLCIENSLAGTEYSSPQLRRVEAS